MKLSTGQEPYDDDPHSHIRSLETDWWNDLSEAIQEEGTWVKHKAHWLLATCLRVLDWLIRTLALSGAHFFLIKKNREEILSHRPQWDFYKNLASKHDASLVFHTPAELDSNRLYKKEKKFLGNGTIYQCQLPSQFETLNPFFRESYWQYHKHKSINFELWQHKDNKARPTYIFMHGYNADAYKINHMIFSARKVFNEGANIVFLVLPFHSGKLSLGGDVWNFFGHGPAYSTEVFAHAVFNCRTVISYLLNNNIASKIGISGISLGGFVASLVMAVEDRIDNAVLLAPVYNVPETYMEWFPLKGLFEKLLKEENISFTEFRHAYALCNTLTFKSRLAPEKITILTGIFDLIALPKHIRLLGEHWGKCDIHWLEYGHVGMTQKEPFLALIQQHINKTGFLNK